MVCGMTRSQRANLLGCLAIAGWSTSGAAGMLLVGRIGPLLALGLVTGLAAMLLGLVEMARGHHPAALLRLPPLQAIVGGGCFIGYQMLFYLALGRSTGPLMSIQLNLVNYLWPTLVVLVCAVRDRKATPVRADLLAIGIVCSIAGMSCSAIEGFTFAAFARLGDLAAVHAAPGAFISMLGAAVCWAGYSLVTRCTADFTRPSSLPAFFGLTSLVSLMASDGGPGGIPWSPALLALLAATAAIPTAGGYLLWEMGIAHGEPRLLGAMSNALPLLSTLVAAAALGLPLSAHLLVAGIMVASGAILTVRASTMAAKEPLTSREVN